MDAIDANGAPTAWPECLPVEKRHVLRRQTALQPNLEGFWAAYLELSELLRSNVRSAIEALVNEADAFGARLGRITRMPALWRAATRPITSHDTAEDIAMTAAKIADGIEEYRRALSGSALSVLMPASIFTADNSAISKLLARIEANSDNIDPNLIETLVAAGARRSVRELCDQIGEKHTIAHLQHDPSTILECCMKKPDITALVLLRDMMVKNSDF